MFYFYAFHKHCAIPPLQPSFLMSFHLLDEKFITIVIKLSTEMMNENDDGGNESLSTFILLIDQLHQLQNMQQIINTQLFSNHCTSSNITSLILLLRYNKKSKINLHSQTYLFTSLLIYISDLLCVRIFICKG